MVRGHHTDLNLQQLQRLKIIMKKKHVFLNIFQSCSRFPQNVCAQFSHILTINVVSVHHGSCVSGLGIQQFLPLAFRHRSWFRAVHLCMIHLCLPTPISLCKKDKLCTEPLGSCNSAVEVMWLWWDSQTSSIPAAPTRLQQRSPLRPPSPASHHSLILIRPAALHLPSLSDTRNY